MGVNVKPVHQFKDALIAGYALARDPFPRRFGCDGVVGNQVIGVCELACGNAF